MSGADNPAEQSMEEILASIRKIISEEPIGTRPETPQASYANASVPASGAAQDPVAPKRANGGDAISIDDALGLPVSPTSERAPSTKLPAANPASERRWSFSNPFGGAQSAKTAQAAPVPGSPPASPNDGANARDGRKPFLPTFDRDPASSVNGAASGAAAAGRAPTVAGNGAAAAPSEADPALIEAREKVVRHLGKAAADMEGPAALGLKSIRDAATLESKPVKPQPKPISDGLVARTAAVLPSSDALEPYSPIARTAASRAPTGERSDAQQAGARKADGGTPAASANGAAAPGSIKAQSSDAAAARPGETSSASAGAVQTTARAQISGESARTLEAAVAELLRPMLREWLDANLPRMVQQVLRDEMSKSPLPNKDVPGA